MYNEICNWNQPRRLSFTRSHIYQGSWVIIVIVINLALVKITDEKRVLMHDVARIGDIRTMKVHSGTFYLLWYNLYQGKTMNKIKQITRNNLITYLLFVWTILLSYIFLICSELQQNLYFKLHPEEMKHCLSAKGMFID